MKTSQWDSKELKELKEERLAEIKKCFEDRDWTSAGTGAVTHGIAIDALFYGIQIGWEKGQKDLQEKIDELEKIVNKMQEIRDNREKVGCAVPCLLFWDSLKKTEK